MRRHFFAYILLLISIFSLILWDPTGVVNRVVQAATLSLEPGFPVMYVSSAAQQTLSGPGVNVVVANIDADPNLEMIVSNQIGGPLTAWNADGTPVHGWPVSGPTGYTAIAGAGELVPAIPGMEVVAVYSFASTTTHQIAAYSGNGNLLPGFPINLNTHISSGPVLANLVGDSRDEIIVGTQDGKLYVYLADGTLAPGWPVQMSGQQTGTPILVDLDGNGDREIVVTNYEGATSNAKLYAFHPNGTVVSGFPTTFRRDTAASAYLAAGDVDGDGQVEIVSPGLDPNNASLVRIFSHSGSLKRQILMPTFPI